MKVGSPGDPNPSSWTTQLIGSELSSGPDRLLLGLCTQITFGLLLSLLAGAGKVPS